MINLAQRLVLVVGGIVSAAICPLAVDEQAFDSAALLIVLAVAMTFLALRGPFTSR